jgi:Ni2+-binding GTPase involved in maturation of urease and hydrogenase
LALINTVDLLEHVDFDLDVSLPWLDVVHPTLEHTLVSARTGGTLERSCGWLRFAGSDAAPAPVERAAVPSL